MRVLVTGAAGFIGSHLCESLLARDCNVVGVDNFITGSRDNLEPVAHHPRFDFIEQDVTGYIRVAGPLDWVLHFASPASPRDYLELPIQTLKVGALGTHNALGLAKATGARFLLASTSEVYGDPLMHPQREDYWGNVNPIGPRGVYDEAKRFAEAMTMAYHRAHGVDTRIARFFNTHGPRMRLNDGRAIPAFMTQALTGAPLTVFGDGSQTRSFQYISDLVEGVWLLMARGQRAGEHRQPARADAARAGQAHQPAIGLAQRDRVPPAARGRPQGAPARHHARQDAARLGAARGHRRGPQAHARMVPRADRPLTAMLPTEE